MDFTNKKAKISGEQKTLLIDLVEQNAEIRNGKFSSEFTYKSSQNCWREIALQLNAMGPVKKDWKQWRKSWQDIKTKTKCRGSELRRHMQQTGGGEPQKELSLVEKRVLNIIGSVAVSGHPNTPTSNVSFEHKEVETENLVLEHKEVETENLVLEHNYYQPEVPEMIVDNEVYLEESNQILQANVEKVSTSLSNRDNMDYLQDMNFNEENKITPEPKGNNKKTNKKRLFKTRRLENSLNTSQKLVEQTEAKLKFKKLYYEKKLILMEESNEVQRNIAGALNKIAEALF